MLTAIVRGLTETPTDPGSQASDAEINTLMQIVTEDNPDRTAWDMFTTEQLEAVVDAFMTTLVIDMLLNDGTDMQSGLGYTVGRALYRIAHIAAERGVG